VSLPHFLPDGGSRLGSGRTPDTGQALEGEFIERLRVVFQDIAHEFAGTHADPGVLDSSPGRSRHIGKPDQPAANLYFR